MADWLDRIERAREHVGASWDEAQVERALGRLNLRRRRRVVGAAVAAALAVAGTLGALFLLAGRGPTEGARAPATAGVLRFWDGSTATPLDARTELVVKDVSAERIAVVVARGKGRFDVTPGLPRLFRVETGRVAVVVVGTAFTVRGLHERAEVAVERGRVRVEWPGGSRELAAPSSGWFPPDPTAPPPAPTVRPEPAAVSPRPPAPAASARGWRALAEEGNFQEAWALLRELPPSTVHDEPAELLVAADAARLSGHPAEAVPYLERVVREHRDDPRGPLAAFTLGRVLLNELGHPREAAAAFAEARSLAPSGSLAEDALAREVEAWSRAGEAERARARAEEYLGRYPNGERLRAVRHYGSLE